MSHERRESLVVRALAGPGHAHHGRGGQGRPRHRPRPAGRTLRRGNGAALARPRAGPAREGAVPARLHRVPRRQRPSPPGGARSRRPVGRGAPRHACSSTTASDQPRCRGTRTLAFTWVGSRIVFVCAQQFVAAARRDPMPRGCRAHSRDPPLPRPRREPAHQLRDHVACDLRRAAADGRPRRPGRRPGSRPGTTATRP